MTTHEPKVTLNLVLRTCPKCNERTTIAITEWRAWEIWMCQSCNQQTRYKVR